MTLQQSRWRRRVAATVAVGVVHIALFALVNPSSPERDSASKLTPVILDVVLIPRGLPVIPLGKADSSGDAAPAAPSRVRPALTPPALPPEVMAPPEPAPESALVVGAAPEGEARPGQGQGGEGDGAGRGAGDGSGDGLGGGAPPRLLVGPTQAQLRALHPPAALAARRSGRGVIACRVRLDTRLEGCRILDESPQGQGFGQAALRAAAHFRFRPPVVDGAPQAGRDVTVGVEFGPANR